jgi:hypothetical protein
MLTSEYSTNHFLLNTGGFVSLRVCHGHYCSLTWRDIAVMVNVSTPFSCFAAGMYRCRMAMLLTRESTFGSPFLVPRPRDKRL